MDKAEVQNEQRFAEVKTEITGIKTELIGMKIEITKIKKDVKQTKTDIIGIKADIKERDKKTEKKFDEMRGEIRDLRMDIIGRRVIENFDEIKTDIKYIKECLQKQKLSQARKTTC